MNPRSPFHACSLGKRAHMHTNARRWYHPQVSLWSNPYAHRQGPGRPGATPFANMPFFKKHTHAGSVSVPVRACTPCHSRTCAASYHPTPHVLCSSVDSRPIVPELPLALL